jgi:energy-coupling factor transporter transmembrane protein EcfT
MIGLLLALVVVAIVISLFGGWIFGIAIGAVAIILFVLFIAGFGRRTASPRQP